MTVSLAAVGGLQRFRAVAQQRAEARGVRARKRGEHAGQHAVDDFMGLVHPARRRAW